MPKSKQECERIRAEAKEKILSKAIEVFSKKGYSATSIRDIAEGVGISMGLMYSYFKSKQELFESIVQVAVDGLIETTRTLSADGNPKEIIDTVCREILEEMDNAEFINISMMIVQGLVSEDNSVYREILYHDKMLFEAAEQLILRGQQEGIFRSGDPAGKSALFFSSIQGMMMMKFFLTDSFVVPSLSELTAFLYEETTR